MAGRRGLATSGQEDASKLRNMALMAHIGAFSNSSPCILAEVKAQILGRRPSLNPFFWSHPS